MRRFIVRMLLPKSIKNQIDWLSFSEINRLENPNLRKFRFPEHINKIKAASVKEVRDYLNLK